MQDKKCIPQGKKLQNNEVHLKSYHSDSPQTGGIHIVSVRPWVLFPASPFSNLSAPVGFKAQPPTITHQPESRRGKHRCVHSYLPAGTAASLSCCKTQLSAQKKKKFHAKVTCNFCKKFTVQCVFPFFQIMQIMSPTTLLFSGESIYFR